MLTDAELDAIRRRWPDYGGARLPPLTDTHTAWLDVRALLAVLDAHRAVSGAAARYLRSLRAGLPVLVDRGADSPSFCAAADQSTAALQELKDALAALDGPPA